MSETHISRAQQGPVARSAIWLTCPDCGHTSRVLAVMASRVLAQRRECPECHSAQQPFLRQAQAGAHIPASEAQLTPVDEESHAYLEAWIDDQGRQSRLRYSLRVLLTRLAARFSRTKRLGEQVAADPSAEGDELGLTPTEHDML